MHGRYGLRTVTFCQLPDGSGTTPFKDALDDFLWNEYGIILDDIYSYESLPPGHIDYLNKIYFQYDVYHNDHLHFSFRNPEASSETRLTSANFNINHFLNNREAF